MRTCNIKGQIGRGREIINEVGVPNKIIKGTIIQKLKIDIRDRATEATSQ